MFDSTYLLETWRTRAADPVTYTTAFKKSSRKPESFSSLVESYGIYILTCSQSKNGCIHIPLFLVLRRISKRNRNYQMSAFCSAILKAKGEKRNLEQAVFLSVINSSQAAANLHWKKRAWVPFLTYRGELWAQAKHLHFDKNPGLLIHTIVWEMWVEQCLGNFKTHQSQQRSC